ncbi:MarR family transcriptional regulator [Gottfriedia sp. NPDC058432]|uniref:MarR family transcriptional regulator n=1 Tax=Gottfriedia sp. NPDC058432 TaxID=3346497 RepID=UPI00365043B8
MDKIKKNILDGYIKLIEKNNEEDKEKKWLIQNCKNQELLMILQEITILMLHVLDCIQKHQPVKGITVANELNMQRGTITKITRKLAEKNLIIKECVPNNNKEIYFRTTKMGNELCDLHQLLHKEINKNYVKFIDQYSKQELMFLEKILDDLSKTSFVKLNNSN